MARILVVEDEQDLQLVLSYNLRKAGHEVVAAQGGHEALRIARDAHPDLVLLDLMLPDLGGGEVCQRLKRDPTTSSIPVVMLTAKGQEADRIAGFELGAEDYVVKPFSVRELLLRLGVILKRGTAQGDDPAGRVLPFGLLELEPEAHRVRVDGQEVDLTALEFRLLCTLFERRDRVQTRSRLLEDVWGGGGDSTSRTVDTHIKRLREKLGPAGEYVQTVRGVGYRFMASPGTG